MFIMSELLVALKFMARYRSISELIMKILIQT